MKPILDLSVIDTTPVDGRTKGFPLDAAAMALADIGKQGWNVLCGDFPSPVAIIREGALARNVAFMRDFTARSGLRFAPHGKTTMSPHLFERQLQAGAWGITFANLGQAAVAIACGLRRVLIANQVIAPRDIAGLAALMWQLPDLEIHVLVDSREGIDRLDNGMAKVPRKLDILVEIGHDGGRTGCRTGTQALTLCEGVAASRHLTLAGLECYEGLALTGDDVADRAHVKKLVGLLAATAREADQRGLFGAPEIILSAGGSAAFDLVSHDLPQTLSRPVVPVLRSGCVVTHDHGFFARMFEHIRDRLVLDKQLHGGLEPALEVWSVVQSCPEPGLAILALGKRDISYDLDLPVARWHFSSGMAACAAAPKSWKITKLNDQHAYLSIPHGASLEVGDLVGCGISHPCTTFDRWGLIYLVDESLNIVSAIRTFF